MTNPSEQGSPALSARGVSKRFGSAVALDNVDITINAGEVLALMGENGAGKSTLIKCLTGVHRPDAGIIEAGGKRIAPSSPRDAERAGISTVYQEVNLIPHLTVAENICLGREPTSPWLLGKIRWGKVKERARAALARVGVDLHVNRELSSCSIAAQQLVAIARALDIQSRVLILDEPTSSLDRTEVQGLFDVLRRLREQGLGMVFVTHFLDQVYAISDRIAVLRDGKMINAHAASTLSREKLVSMMVGREYQAAAKRIASDSSVGKLASPRLEARTIARRGSLHDVSVSVGEGEVVGLVGLLGSGRSETARALFGVDPIDSGEVRWKGRSVKLESVGDAMRLGIAMTPEDRKRDGIIPNLSVRDNIALVLQARRGVRRALSHDGASALAEQFVKKLGIKTASIDTPIRNLSGGNQQKALLARWIASRPEVLILDEPTRGIDIAAKADILTQIRELQKDGVGVLFISSELEEVVAAADRAVVLRDRSSVAELYGADLTEQAVVRTISEHVRPTA